MRPVLLLSLGLMVQCLHGQCSDAGACASSRVQGPEAHRISLTLQEGASGSPDRLRFRALRVEGRFRISDALRVQVTLPFVKVDGPLGGTRGLGDTVAVLDWTFAAGTRGSWSAQAGTRLSTGRADGDPALPQKYQTGLGGTDAILGLRWSGASWMTGAAFQKAGTRNSNSLTRLQRGDDLLLWLGREHTWNRTRLSLKALALQRLSKSSVRNPQPGAPYVDIPRSDRLQINLEATLTTPLALGWDLQLAAALPTQSRPTNDDGLKRAWTASVGVGWSF